MIRKYFDRENRAALRATKRRLVIIGSTLPVVLIVVIVTWGQAATWIAVAVAALDCALVAYLGSRWAHRDAYLRDRPGPGY